MTMILRQGLTLILICGGLGIVGALVMSRTLESLVFGITPYDASTFLGVSALLGAVALAACYLPARRASQVDPMDTLRAE